MCGINNGLSLHFCIIPDTRGWIFAQVKFRKIEIPNLLFHATGGIPRGEAVQLQPQPPLWQERFSKQSVGLRDLAASYVFCLLDRILILRRSLFWEIALRRFIVCSGKIHDLNIHLDQGGLILYRKSSFGRFYFS